MVLEGVYEHLELRGGHLRGSIRRVGTAAPAQAGVTEHGLQHAAISEQVSDFGKEASPVVAPSTGVESGLPPPGDTVHPDWLAAPGTQAPSAALAAVSDSAPGYLGAPVNRYAVSPADHTIRQALGRWASAAGWTFSAEHWAVDVDIPLVGEASFETDFKSAVRELLAATEMGDRPLQPCFYSNRVLRVVPYAQPCDRRAGRGAAS
ncbi:MAG: pilus assembly protein [Alcaligenaceae bacterium]|nr:pilus assembly protein [Alcaligenaceae bacterium]